MKLFLVEDDAVIAGAVQKHLEAWGYQCVCARDFQNVAGEFAQLSPQLVILDITLPYFNGYHWCTEIRKLSKVPILFLSSAADNMNIVMAMNMGGDDFIAKPFDLSVLVAKVQALLRLSYDFSVPGDVLTCGDVVLRLGDGVAVRGERQVELSRNELRILQVLFTNKGKAVSRETLMQRLWETDLFVDTNTLTVNINRLRRRLEELGCEGLIKTKKGVGYMVE